MAVLLGWRDRTEADGASFNTWPSWMLPVGILGARRGRRQIFRLRECRALGPLQRPNKGNPVATCRGRGSCRLSDRLLRAFRSQFLGFNCRVMPCGRDQRGRPYLGIYTDVYAVHRSAIKITIETCGGAGYSNFPMPITNRDCTISAYYDYSLSARAETPRAGVCLSRQEDQSVTRA